MHVHYTWIYLGVKYEGSRASDIVSKNINTHTKKIQNKQMLLPSGEYMTQGHNKPCVYTLHIHLDVKYEASRAYGVVTMETNNIRIWLTT